MSKKPKIFRRNGIHIYFMLTWGPEECDVAYLTPDISCLSIHKEPRPWASELLAALRPIERGQHD